jgi:UDP-N-acetylmuramyl pentapeptide phosphotransferase/UDP-N-acetylglucosamine-1-phosphate transferase
MTYLNVKVKSEGGRAAFEQGLFGGIMEVQMLRQVRALREALGTTFEVALEWFFFGVDSQVVEEVAALAELFAAPVILALHNTSHSFGISMFIFEYFIMGRIGNIFALTDGMEGLTVSEAIFLCFDSIIS